MPERASSCRSCGRPILWARLNTGAWSPLDPEPHERGQMVLLDGGRCHPVEPGGRYGADVQARRHRSHVTTCGLGPRVRTVGSSARAVSADAGERQQRVRQVRSAMGRRRMAG